jgi:hypothetical protein
MGGFNCGLLGFWIPYSATLLLIRIDVLDFLYLRLFLQFKKLNLCMIRKSIILFLCVALAAGCKKDSDEDITNGQPDPGYTVYKNQSGNANADALQAQLYDKDRNETISFYGNFDTDGNPGQPRSTTYQKGDTLVHMIINPENDKVETMFYEVAGVKQPLVMRYVYFPGSDSSFRFSMYTYDWTTKTGTLQFESMVFAVNGVFENDPIYANLKVTTMSWNDMTKYLSLSLLIINLVLNDQLFLSIPQHIPALSSFSGVWMTLMTALYQTHLAAHHLSTANPAPSGKSYPSGTPASNPSTPNDPKPNLAISSCGTITFFADMNEQGKITFVDPQGGVAPYKYSATGLGGFESTATLMGTYQHGKQYNLTVKDSKGCMGSLIMSFD